MQQAKPELISISQHKNTELILPPHLSRNRQHLFLSDLYPFLNAHSTAELFTSAVFKHMCGKPNWVSCPVRSTQKDTNLLVPSWFSFCVLWAKCSASFLNQKGVKENVGNFMWTDPGFFALKRSTRCNFLQQHKNETGNL